MNKTFIANLENHSVYLINIDNISFYFNILNKKITTDLTVDIDYKKKDSINDIINYYGQIDNYNITLIVPVIKFSSDNKDFYKYCNEISKIINTTYKLLVNNNVPVNNNNINIIKHTNINSDLSKFFRKKFSNRVRYISLEELVQEEVPYNKIITSNFSFVVGKPEIDATIKEEEMQEILDQVKQEEVHEEKSKIVNYGFASGHVSFALLGALIAILSLLFINLLTK